MKKIFLLLFILANFYTSFSQTWSTLSEELNKHYQGGSYQEGLSIVPQAIKAAETEFGKKHENYAITLLYAGHLNNLTFHYTEAIAYYKAAADIYKELYGEHHKYYGIAIINEANVYKTLNHFSKAEALMLRGIKVIGEASGENSAEKASYNSYLGQLYESMGKLREAHRIYEENANISKTTSGENSMEYANALFTLAWINEKEVQYDKAIDLYRQCGGIYDKNMGANNFYHSSMLNYTAHCYHLMGEYATAEKLYLEALQHARKNLGEDHEYYGTYLLNIGNLYQAMGRIQEAADNYTKASDIYRKKYGENHLYFATCLNNLAILYTDAGDYEQAAEYFEHCSKIYRLTLGEFHEYNGTTLVNLGRMYQMQGDYIKSEQALVKACEIFRKALGETHPDYAKALNTLAFTLSKRNNLKKAEEMYLQAMNIQERQLGPYHPDLAMTTVNLARLYQRTAKPVEAEKLYRKVNSNLLHQVSNFFPSLSEKEKEQFYQNLNVNLDYFNAFALQRYIANPTIAEDVYNNQLQTKALLFNAATRVRDNIFSGNNKELIDLYRQWLAQKEYIGKAYLLTKDQINTQGIDLQKLETEANTLEKKLSQLSEEFSGIVNRKQVTMKDLQQKLQPGEAAIEMIRVKEKDASGKDSVMYAALILTREYDFPHVAILKNGNALETKYFKYYRNSLNAQTADPYSYQHYWSEIQSHLKGIKKIYFSAEGVYNQINLNTLYNTQAQKYLGEEADILLVSNTKDILTITETSSYASKNTALFGYPDYTHAKSAKANGGTQIVLSSLTRDSIMSRFMNGGVIPPLPGTKKEVEKIAALLKSGNASPAVYLGQEASEEQLKALSRPGVMHIATHGYFMEDTDFSADERTISGIDKKRLSENPLLRSGLLLAGASNAFKEESSGQQGENGVLTAYEAMNLDLYQTQLVILSACETGLGEIRNGEGVYGLQRAFQIAGAKNIIMSLWRVNDDATQELMVAFYQNWLQSGNMVSAFKEAQLALKEKYKHPYYWGAFILVGR